MADLKVIYCYMNGCGWCDKFKPVWEELKKELDNGIDGCKSSKYKAYERDQISDPNTSANKFDGLVEGYPTILIKINDDVHKYEGNRTIEDILKFIANKINMQKGGSLVDYRAKYKKYKNMYAEIVSKYNNLKNKQII